MWMMPRELRFSECLFSYEMQPSDEPPRESMIYCGNEDIDKARLAEIYRRIEAGDHWAWCNVTVLATWESFEGTYTLHVGTYSTRLDFEEWVLPELKQQALATLNEVIASTARQLQRLM